MFRDVVTLLWAPLALSCSIHVGGLVLMDACYGATARPAGQTPGATRLQANFRLLGGRPSAETQEGDAPSTASPPPLPEGVISLPGPYYFPSEALSRKPRAAMPVPLEYPEEAPPLRNRLVLRLYISESGDVDLVMVEAADVPAELEKLARKAFAQAKFLPGMRGEAAVKSQLLVEITFEGENLPQPAALLPVR